MPTDVIMPQMGESIFEGTITKWLKKPGDPVEKDEPLFEISTDKVDAEIPSPITGTLSEIKFPEGATVQVNTVVAILVDRGPSMAVASSVQKPSPPQTVTTEAPKAQVPRVAEPQVATEIVMPQMGESIFEGTITKWLKKVGDPVRKDEPLFEISTDKVDAEIPSPVDGVLTEIKIAEGATVQVNTVVAILMDSRPSVPAASSEEKSSPSQTVTTQAPKAQLAAPQVPQLAAPQVPQLAGQQVPQLAGQQVPQGAAQQVPLRSSPLVRRIAKENNIDLAQVAGTGSNGRITKEDILQHLSRPDAAQLAPKAQLSAPSAAAMKDEVVPLTKMRAIIAQRMLESKRNIPHAHTVYKVDMTRIVKLRERERAGFAQRHGFKLTYMPFIAAATIGALRKFPILNASLIENSIHYHANIHLGIAVALEWGLIVPVIRSSEGRDFVSVARAIQDLAGRARSKKLSPNEVGGSTFTLTNSGAFGGEYGMPIINQPESAILAIGGLRKEPAVLTDFEGNDSIAIRSMQYFCLGFDHRLIDGADSGKFMTEFKTVLESWDQPIG